MQNLTLAAIIKKFNLGVWGTPPKLIQNKKEVGTKFTFCVNFFFAFYASVYILAMLARVKTSDFFRTKNVSEAF